MSEVFKQTVARLPDIMSRNAASMMKRILQATQLAIGTNPQLGPKSYLALILRASNDDLVRHFDLAIKEAMSEVQGQLPGFAASGMGLSMEPLEPADLDQEAAFSSSTVAFEKLCAKAADAGCQGLIACSKNVVLVSFDQAFRKSEMGRSEAKTIIPLARRALNNELTKLYEKLEAL